MTQVRSFWPWLIAGLVCSLSAALSSRAEPLAKDQCDAIAAEHVKLTEQGLPELVKKGPEWVRTNIGADRVRDVARYISLHEELLFRCGYDKLKTLPGIESDEAGETDSPPPLPERKPPVPESFKTRSVSASDPAERPKPKPRPKVKVNDAYQPPPRSGWAPQ